MTAITVVSHACHESSRQAHESERDRESLREVKPMLPSINAPGRFPRDVADVTRRPPASFPPSVYTDPVWVIPAPALVLPPPPALETRSQPLPPCRPKDIAPPAPVAAVSLAHGCSSWCSSSCIPEIYIEVNKSRGYVHRVAVAWLLNFCFQKFNTEAPTTRNIHRHLSQEAPLAGGPQQLLVGRRPWSPTSRRCTASQCSTRLCLDPERDTRSPSAPCPLPLPGAASRDTNCTQGRGRRRIGGQWHS